MATTARWRNGQLLYMESARMWKEVWPAYPGAWLHDDFEGVATTDMSTAGTAWKMVPNTGAAMTLETVTGAHGVLKVNTHTAEGDNASVAGPLVCWLPSQNPTVEVRIAVEAADHNALFVGFSDEVNEADTAAPIYRTHGDGSWTTDATDAVGLIFDPHYVAGTGAYGHAVKNGTDATTPITTAIPLVANTFQTWRIELVDNGSATTAYFWIDGVCYGSLSDCVTRTVALTPFISVMTRAAAAHYGYIDYIKCWSKHS